MISDDDMIHCMKEDKKKTQADIEAIIKTYYQVDNWFQLDVKNLVWRMNEETFLGISTYYGPPFPPHTKIPLIGSHLFGIPIEVVEADEILLVIKVR